MELKATYYVKACKKIRDMLREFPTIKQTLSRKERQKLTVDLAKYLQRKDEEKNGVETHTCEDSEDESSVFTKEEYCKHCIYHSYINRQVICDLSGHTVSKFRKGRCEKFKEGYKTIY